MKLLIRAKLAAIVPPLRVTAGQRSSVPPGGRFAPPRGGGRALPSGSKRHAQGWLMTGRLTLYDTTLRDGQQTQGVQFSSQEKREIAGLLDGLGVDYIEGGWPGANPTDSAFFEVPPATRATLAAFGMTKRAGRSAENDDVLAAVLNARTPAVCLVGKTHTAHVAGALGITDDENLDNVRASIAHVVAQGREAIFDAEHFFDGFGADSGYARSCIEAALEAGARWAVLCDTDGGTMPARIGAIVADLVAGGIPRRTAWASTPTTTPARPSPGRSPRSTRVPATSRAR